MKKLQLHRVKVTLRLLKVSKTKRRGSLRLTKVQSKWRLCRVLLSNNFLNKVLKRKPELDRDVEEEAEPKETVLRKD